MNEPLHLAVVGYGYWGPNLVRNFNAVDGVNVQSICEYNQLRRDQARLRYQNIQLTDDFQSILDDSAIDAIAIATPAASHHRLAMAAMNAGKHIFVEKPLACNLNDALEMVITARSLGLTLMVGHTFLYAPAVRKMREIVKAGDLGDILYVNAQRLNLGLFQKDINVVLDLAPHDISILLWLIDEKPISVHCAGSSHYVDGIEDVATLCITFPSGAFAIITTSWLDPCKTRKFHVVGNRKMITYDDLETLEKLRVYDKRVDVPPYFDGLGEFQCAYHYGDVISPYFKQYEPLQMECAHFIDCVRSGREPESGGEEALKVMQVLDAAQRSLKTGGVPMPLEPIPPGSA